MSASTSPELVQDVVDYLAHRNVWPLPSTDLRGVARADYWHEKQRVGVWAALLAPVRDYTGELVTAHITYLLGGRKLERGTPSRKIMSRMVGRYGCSVRLGKASAELGIAEGIESALAAARIHGRVVWSALSAGMLAKWKPPEPPEGVEHVTIYPDRDDAGLEAAETLTDLLQEDGLSVSLRIPRGGAGDWADALDQR